jgi:cytochrome c oxidase subunit IV
MGAFDIIVQTMMEMGFRLFLPWLLVLSVTYGLLEKYQVVSDETQVNGSIALAMAFLTILGVNQYAPAGIFTNFAAAVSFGLFGLLGFMVLIAVTGYDLENYTDGGTPRWFAVTIFVVSFITVVVSYVDVGQMVAEGSAVFSDVILPILVLIFFILIVRETARA